MNLLARFNAAVQEYTSKLAVPKRKHSSSERPSQIDGVLSDLSPVIEQATKEFAAIRLGQTSVPNATVFLLDSKSTLVRSTLLFLPESAKFFRCDVLDLNVSDVLFELAGKTREENLETHNFLYNTREEAVDAYLQWFAWAVALLRNESSSEELRDGAA